MSNQQEMFSKTCSGCKRTIYWRTDLTPSIFVEDPTSDVKHECGLWKPTKSTAGGGYKKQYGGSGYGGRNYGGSSSKSNVDWEAINAEKKKDIQRLHDETVSATEKQTAALNRVADAFERLAGVLETKGLVNE